MPAKDFLHDTVINALIQDGWAITHDPFVLPFGRRNLYADLGAERILVAERENSKIVVEIKSFAGYSLISELQKAIGQYFMYRMIIDELYPEYNLYIAMDNDAFKELFQDADGQKLLQQSNMKVFTINPVSEKIERWIS